MNNKTLVVGWGQFIAKNAYHQEVYSKNNLETQYLIRDMHGNSQFYADKYGASIKILSKNKIISIFEIWKTFKDFKRCYCELYDTGNMTFVYLFFSIIYKCKLLLILRGGEIQKHNRKKLSVNYIKHWLVSKFADKVIYKEKNIKEEYIANGYPVSKLFFVGNAVPSQDPSILKKVEDRDIDILFLNSIRKTRHVLFLVQCIEKLSKVYDYPIRCVIAGFNSLTDESLSYDLDEEKKILKYINEHKLGDIIDIQPFVKKPYEFFNRSKIFALPADIIFANYSLLESMSYGVVPIVSKGEGAEKIVTNLEGYSLDLDIDSWVKAMVVLLQDINLWEKKSLASRDRIKCNFSLDQWFNQMMLARQ